LSRPVEGRLLSFASLAVEFLQLPGLGAVELVKLHELWGDQFPKLREQPALPPSLPVGTSQGFPFQFTVGAPAMRLRDKAHALIVHDGDLKRRQRDKRTSALAKTAQIVHRGEGGTESIRLAEPAPGQ
jgi:hypothetical protein